MSLLRQPIFCRETANPILKQVIWCLLNSAIRQLNQGILQGKYHCTIDLLFDWFGINSMKIDNFCFYLQNRLIQTGQTGGQWYSDTSPFSIPWLNICFISLSLCARVGFKPLNLRLRVEYSATATDIDLGSLLILCLWVSSFLLIG